MRCNDRAAMFRADCIVNTNFKKGDYYITFTFAPGRLPETEQEIKNAWRAYKAKLQRLYKRKGKELKYYGVLQDKNCRPHFHFVFNNDGVNLAEFPEWKYGNPKIELLDGRAYHNIGSYFARGTTKENSDGKTEHYRGRVYSSRNLKRPKMKTTRLKGPNWSDVPKNRKGFYVDKSTIECGETENVFTGNTYRYQSYVLVRQKDRMNC